MNTKWLFLRFLRKVYRTIHKNEHDYIDESRVQFSGQIANDYVRNAIINSQNGLMISKFGTVELGTVCSCLTARRNKDLNDYRDFIIGKKNLDPSQNIEFLYNNAGVFPRDIDIAYRFTDLVLEDIKEIDILGSYIDQESYLSTELQDCVKIDIYSYCVPYAYKNPWTKALKGKKVLVVHPFTESIKKQYDKRELLFGDPDVLPTFAELYCVKAVQSIAGNGANTGFKDWFEALQYMENEIDKYDFDIALIGCGAYGMSLAAYCKRKGKIAIHMASWVQMLFGIYGQRWAVDQPQYACFINDSWIRPSESEKPSNHISVENGAYW